MKILIVCSGNTCRSPMGAGLLRKIANERGLQVEVRSAGLQPHSGGRVAPHAFKVMKEINIDISDDYSKPVLPELSWADIIVPVAKCHAIQLEEIPQAVSKIRRLEQEVLDPVTKPIEKYREARDHLDDLLSRLVDQLLGSTKS